LQREETRKRIERKRIREEQNGGMIFNRKEMKRGTKESVGD
jgi:hypothetical protein